VLSGRRPQLVVKLVRADPATGVDLRSAARAMRLAAEAGVPVPRLLAVDTTRWLRGWAYLLAEHVDGVPWRQEAAELDPERRKTVHRDLAASVLALQSVTLPAFGALGTASGSQPDLATAVRQRADQRVRDPRRRDLIGDLLERDAGAFVVRARPVLTHDDLHHGNVLVREQDARWTVVAVLDWDKAWAGPGEWDVARMAFWDDMTGRSFWETYRAARPLAPGEDHRRLIYQLIWCLEHEWPHERHRADTAALCHLLGVPAPR
jgi:aminoglycoside phosphotransferase (APT) family kinase protein